jgi:hypothetical protein
VTLLGFNEAKIARRNERTKCNENRLGNRVLYVVSWRHPERRGLDLQRLAEPQALDALGPWDALLRWKLSPASEDESPLRTK